MPIDKVDGTVLLRQAHTVDLSAFDIAAIRALLDLAFGDDPEEGFTEDDWQHALGGLHVVAEEAGRIVGHASVVPRTLWIGDRPIRTGYVEAVATEPSYQGQGIGTALMRAAGRHIEDGYELGALGTGAQHFYERLGWRAWRGPSSVRAPDEERRTPDEDGYILVLETPSTPQPLDLDSPIACDWRSGDVW
jgi:aminoglycoside 2'-N-acetyltransferase I